MKHLQPKKSSLLTGISLMLFCFPFLLLAKPLDGIEGLVGPLTQEQQRWLDRQPAVKMVLVEISSRDHWSDQQRANAIFDHFTAEADPILSASQMVQEVAILKLLHPEWCLARVVFAAAWNMAKGQAHSILDLAGLVPGLGEGADLVNGVFYILEGDKANAALSFAAMVPFAGWVATGAKYAGKIVKTAAGYTAELKFVVNSKGVITFGNRSQLARVLGKKANHRAHHIIPWSKNSHKVVQQAADSGDWHPNMTINGIHLDKTVHNGYDHVHRAYNTRLENVLNTILNNAGGNISATDAAKALQDLAQDISYQLKQGKKLDEITF